MRNETAIPEALARRALREEASDIGLPNTLWARVEAQLQRQHDTVPMPAYAPDPARLDNPRELILALLAEGEMDGFALARRIEDLARHAERPATPEAIVLPLLHRLEREGLARARWRLGPRGVRRAYALRSRGRRIPFLSLLPGRIGRWRGHRRVPLPGPISNTDMRGSY
jgi:hypothetical protein